VHRPRPGHPAARLAVGPGSTERSAYGIVTDLTAAGYVAKQKDGRRNRYQIQAHLRLPEPASQEPAIGGVLALLAGAGGRLQLTGTGPAGGHRVRPGAPRWTRITGVLPGPGLPPDEPRRHAIAALSGEPGIASVPAAPSISPGLLPRCRQPACHRPVPGELP
jgi:hypothetical protein